MTLCGERREAGWSFRHNVKPGTPVGRGVPWVLVGFGLESPSGRADIVGRASSLPISVVEGGEAFPEKCGVLGRCVCPVLGSLIAGLLGRCDAGGLPRSRES